MYPRLASNPWSSCLSHRGLRLHTGATVIPARGQFLLSPVHSLLVSSVPQEADLHVHSLIPSPAPPPSRLPDGKLGG